MQKINRQNRNQDGLVKLIVMIVIVIIILSYFKVDPRSIVESEAFKSTTGLVINWAQEVWDNYLQSPILYIWHDLVRPMFK